MSDVVYKEDMLEAIEDTFEGKPEWGYATAMKALAQVPVASMKVGDILEQVKADMCDDYCKVPGICQKAGIDGNLMLKDFCEHCPLERL